MNEPKIQVQKDKPPTLVNSEWVTWASSRINELEQELSETQAELDSLRDFCQSEIRKLPPEYVKSKGRASGD